MTDGGGERQRRNERPAGGRAPGGENDDGLDAITSRVNAILSAGDQAIQRALSGDSESFLGDTRQQGGQ